MSKMLKPFSLLSRKKPATRPFKDYYLDWFNTLKNHLIPLLDRSLSSSAPAPLLSSYVHLLLHHILSFYDALDAAATPDSIPHLLFPSWRTPIETPFLVLGDLHPYLFTNLLRSFLDDQSDDEVTQSDVENEERSQLYDVGDLDFDLERPWQVAMAWKDVSKNLMTQIEQIECGVRLMVPALLDRARKAQTGFVRRVAEAWVDNEGKKERVVGVGEAVKMEMEEMVVVFADANRLRKSVITEIVGALDVFQGALFLEGLAQFLVGFRDPDLLSEFEKCKTPINKQARLAL
ncbi:hypothetical protein HS088_TW16G00865 [Tripterygium wilfordii]|uniref:DOG1 domain-containing protein n=1 Tax=Tripterygium wilfordii TaxID=458696 RepID=A0A7J7CKA1_TRIWF|nr:protein INAPERTURATE POLLEN1 [Tripterygium wilfordii]XP_038679347.1 protein INAPERTURATE POLLEN1 [Tripterygium wilfordii]KAF5734416.1 hypothetical protein HS088_TW16G00865 [Tripterygium wilfordii]